MKKKMILLAGSLMAVAAVATTMAATSSNDEASLLMRNVEAVAGDENGSYQCPGGCMHWAESGGGGITCTCGSYSGSCTSKC